MESSVDAGAGKDGHHGPVHLLQLRVAVEAVVHGGDRAAPHEDDDAEVVELVACVAD